MSKHHPGPWRYDRDNLNVYGNGMLAQVCGHTHSGEREANARLIATAPCMLDALKAALIELKDPVNKIGAIAAVERAIKMAEGGE